MPTPAATSSPLARDRLVFLDLFRGLAVFFMFDAHITGALVRLGPQAGSIHAWHNLTFNMPAPAFLFAAGLSFGMGVYSRWDQYHGWSAPVRRRASRILEVLFTAYLLHVPSTALSTTLLAPEAEMRRFLGWDILQCIGYTLLLLLLLALAVPRREWFAWATLVLAVGIAFATAVVSSLGWTGQPPPLHLPWWIATIFSRQLGSNFPLFPYAVFLLAGVVWGYLFAQARESDRSRQYITSSFWTGLIAVVVCLILKYVPLPSPFDDFWGGSPVFTFLRLGMLVSSIAVMYFWEDKLVPALGFLVTLGKESLCVYFVHLLIVYGSPVTMSLNLRTLFTQSIGLWTWLGLLISLTVAMTALASYWGRLKLHHGPTLDRALWTAAALATIGYLIR